MRIGVIKLAVGRRLLALAIPRLLRLVRGAKEFLIRERNTPSLCTVLKDELPLLSGSILSNVVVYREVQGVSIHAVSKNPVWVVN